MRPYFTDARTLPDEQAITTDVCIIGAGAAGLTAMLELKDSGLDVAVFEAGGLNPSPRDKDLLSGETPLGSYDLQTTRLRYFGGTTNHWGGQSPPLEAVDFEAVPHIPGSGWPYGLDVLEPYYERAATFMGLREVRIDPATVAAQTGKRLLPFSGALRTTFAAELPFRFGLHVTDTYGSLDKVRIYLNADLTDLAFAPDSSALDSAAFATVAGNTLRVRARYFVLATGGIETPRLLLAMNRQRPAGIGNGSDMVGRHWQEHYNLTSGTLVPRQPLDIDPIYVTPARYHDYWVRAHLTMSPEVEAQNRLPRFRSEFAITSEAGAHRLNLSHSNLSPGAIWQVVNRTDDYLAREMCDVPRAPFALRLHNYFQMLPDPNNRVTLSDRRDRFGRPLPSLHIRVGAEEHAGLLRAQRVIADEVARLGIGRLRIELPEEADPPLPGHNYGAHHMGATRMSDDPARGVTDSDARVHETRNLFIAGSSIFPVCGWQNPTFTILATTIKLADHLKDTARKDGAL